MINFGKQAASIVVQYGEIVITL